MLKKFQEFLNENNSTINEDVAEKEILKMFKESVNEGKNPEWKQKIMDDTIKLLIKWGNNPDDVKDMVEKHFEDAIKKYRMAKVIAEYIRTVY